MAHLLDASAFIQAKNSFYRFSFCPGFWEWILLEHRKTNLFSVQRVERELKERQDELASWVGDEVPAGFFVAPTVEVATAQGVVARWVHAQPGFSGPEKARFMSKADPWLIAEAIEHGYEIVTFEEMVPANSTKVKIPNVATNFGVKCVSLFDVLEASGVRMGI